MKLLDFIFAKPKNRKNQNGRLKVTVGKLMHVDITKSTVYLLNKFSRKHIVL